MNIDITYETSELSNLYAFVSDLSNWNLSVFPARRKEWIQRTGRLTRKDSGILKKFSDIHKTSNPLLFLLFFDPTYANPLKILNRKIGKEKAVEIKNILDYFNPRFQKIWKVEKVKLEHIQKKLEREDIGKKSIVKDIAILCGLKKGAENKITCYLGISASTIPDCNGWTSNNIFVLECSGWPIKRLKEICQEMLPHELFHILLRNNKRLLRSIQEIAAINEQLLSDINFEHWKPRMVFEELIISSFVPEGYLIHKQQNRPKKNPRDFQSVREQFAYLLRAQAKQYVLSKKEIDIEYLENAIREIKRAGR
jgi:hypothetical protein